MCEPCESKGELRRVKEQSPFLVDDFAVRCTYFALCSFLPALRFVESRNIALLMLDRYTRKNLDSCVIRVACICVRIRIRVPIKKTRDVIWNLKKINKNINDSTLLYASSRAHIRIKVNVEFPRGKLYIFIR